MKTVFTFVAAIIWAMVNVAIAQPSQKVEIVVPYPAGGNVDILARAYEPVLKEVGIQPKITNYTGLGGIVGYKNFLKADPNSTLFAAGAGTLYSVLKFKDQNVDMPNNLVAVSPIYTSPEVIAVLPESNITAEFLFSQTAEPQRIRVAVGGTIHEYVLAVIQKHSRHTFVPISTPSANNALLAVLNKDADMTIDAYAFLQSYSSKIKFVGVVQTKPIDKIPGISKYINNVEIGQWLCLWANKTQDPSIISYYRALFSKVKAVDLIKMGWVESSLRPDQFASKTNDEITHALKVFK